MTCAVKRLRDLVRKAHKFDCLLVSLHAAAPGSTSPPRKYTFFCHINYTFTVAAKMFPLLFPDSETVCISPIYGPLCQNYATLNHDYYLVSWLITHFAAGMRAPCTKWTQPYIWSGDISSNQCWERNHHIIIMAHIVMMFVCRCSTILECREYLPTFLLGTCLDQ